MPENITAFDKLTNLADAIRNKTGATGALTLDQMTEEVRNFQGGGVELNYQVVSKQPDVPIENTIWVDTENTITRYAFAAQNPWVNQIETEFISSSIITEGYIAEADGSIGAANTTKLNVYTENYIPVKFGLDYDWTYTIASSKAIRLTATEYTEDKVFIQQVDALAETTSASKVGTYTPSSASVKYVRLSWRTYGIETLVTFTGIHDFTDPEEANGAVWFRISDYTHGYSNFNTLISENQLYVYPVQTKQYINDKWLEKTSYIYQNGEWHKWTPYGALYWHGDECVNTSGGWVSQAWTMQSDAGTTAQTFKITKNEDNLTFTKTGQIGAVMRTDKMVDLTNVTTIHFKGEMKPASANGYQARFCIWTKLGGSYWSTNAALTKNGVAGTVTTEFSVDVSALSGFYYIGFGIYQASNYIVLEELIMEE